MKNAVIYIHGKGGTAREAEHYKPLFEDRDVIGFDYRSETPWEAAEEFPRFVDPICKKYGSVILIANSIGAYFAMQGLGDLRIEKAFFISPIVDMETLISNMMTWAGVTEDELRRRGEIPTSFGETLSWEYLEYVRAHPIKWSVPTEILCGENDGLTSPDTVSRFADRIGAGLTVMENGEHWFHTKEQMDFLDKWISDRRRRNERY